MTLAVVLGYRSLLVLGNDPSGPQAVRPRDHAHWDGVLAALLAVTAVVIAAAGSTVGAIVTGAAALVLALLRLRTRYVAG